MKHLLPLTLFALGLSCLVPQTAANAAATSKFCCMNDAALDAEKEKALDLLNNRTEEGTAPGCYTAEDRQVFKKAIEAATTTSEITAATNNYKAKVIKPKISDDKNEYWYYIVSGPSVTYCQDALIYDMSFGPNEQLKWNDRTVNARCMWKFIAGDNLGKTIKIVNKATGLYIKNNGGQGEKAISVSVKPQATAFTLTSLGEQRGFLIRKGKSNPVHADESGVMVSWNSLTLGTASCWHFDEVPSNDLAAVTEGVDDKYEMVWHDEFDVDGRLDSKYWDYEHGFERNQEPQWYQPDNAICENGNLVITARKETVENPYYQEGSSNWALNRKTAEYTSSSVITKGKVDLLYGRIEVRAKIPTTSGAWPAIWCLGYYDTCGWWPACGEIDILEFYDRSIFANLCWSADADGNSRWHTVKTPFTHFTARDKDWSSKYHIWRMDWDSTAVSIYLDDELLNVTSLKRTEQPVSSFNWKPNAFKTPQYLLLNLALRTPDGIDESVFPLKYYIDYARFYKKGDSASTSISTLNDKPTNNWLLTTDEATYVNLAGFGGNPVVKICDISGRVVNTYVPEANTTFELPSQGRGLFLVSVTGKNETRTAKVLMK